jgi:hypothetical protein
MLFYQGEDISFRLKGVSVVDFISNDFYVMIYAAEDSSDSIVLSKGDDDVKQNQNSNVYDCVISHEKTKDMAGVYNMEVLILDKEGRRSIFKQDSIFEVEFSYIKGVLDNNTNNE